MSLTKIAALPRRRQMILLSVAGLALVALSVGATVAIVTLASQKPTVPSDAALFVYDTNTSLVEDNRAWAWSDDANGSLSATDAEAAVECPAGSTNSASFLSLPGGERDPSAWAAWENLGYGGDTVSVILPPLTPDRMGQGAGKAARTNGGTFSLGIACTTNNGLAVTAAYFRSITVEPGGNWKLEPLRN